jgi:hypothetical protein
MNKRLETIRTLPVVLSNREIQSFGEEQSKALLNVCDLKAQRSELNKEIKPLETRINALAEIIDTGIEEREVNCAWLFDYVSSHKTLIREDTGEVLEEKALTETELQQEMPI